MVPPAAIMICALMPGYSRVDATDSVLVETLCGPVEFPVTHVERKWSRGRCPAKKRCPAKTSASSSGE